MLYNHIPAVNQANSIEIQLVAISFTRKRSTIYAHIKSYNKLVCKSSYIGVCITNIIILLMAILV